MYKIRDISVSTIGVQIIVHNLDSLPDGFKESYEPGHDLWPFFQSCVRNNFGGVEEIKGKQLVRVDVASRSSQFSFKDKP